MPNPVSFRAATTSSADQAIDGVISGQTARRCMLPSGTLAGDRCIMVVNGGEAADPQIADITGWTKLGVVTNGMGNQFSAWWKDLTAGDITATKVRVAPASSGAPFPSLLTCYGHDPSVAPSFGGNIGNGGGSGSAVAPAVTMLRPNGLLVVMGGCISGQPTPPTGMTERADFTNIASSSSVANTEAIAASGSTGTRTVTYGTNSGGFFTSLGIEAIGDGNRMII